MNLDYAHRNALMMQDRLANPIWAPTTPRAWATAACNTSSATAAVEQGLLTNALVMKIGLVPRLSRDNHKTVAHCSLQCMPYEPSLARALVAHERAVRRDPDPVYK
jgi:hypothetical protein